MLQHISNLNVQGSFIIKTRLNAWGGVEMEDILRDMC